MKIAKRPFGWLKIIIELFLNYLLIPSARLLFFENKTASFSSELTI